MINFDSLTLKALILEIEPILVQGRVQKVQQPSRNELLINIRACGKNYKLYISIDPRFSHISLLTEKGEEYRNIIIPQKPPMFCMLLRKHIEGAKIKAVRHPKNERILEIYFDSYNELGAKVSQVLACEIMGKHSNIILYSYETNIIHGSAHNVGPEKSREREISGGLPYIYPPKLRKFNLENISEDEFFEMIKAVPTPINIWLNNTFFDISLALATEFCHVTGINIEQDTLISTPVEKISNLYKLALQAISLNNKNPCISNDKKYFSIIGLDSQIKWEKIDSVNSMIDLYFGYQIFMDKFSRLKSNISGVVKKEFKKQKNRLAEYQKIMDSTDKAEKYRQYGDIIMANLHKIKTGAESVSLENFFDDNQSISIQMNTQLSASANAQRYYKLYNKLKNAAKYSVNLINQSKEEINYLESINVAIAQSETLIDLKQILDELVAQKLIKGTEKIKKSNESEKEKINLTQYISSDNYKIYIGKNNKQNDYIISKIASPNDIWLHTQNIPGSHTLIKVAPDNPHVPETTLHEAVNLAAFFSQAKESSNVPVIYTRKKYLKKTPGSKPGYVTYSHEKTLFVNPDEEIVSKLKQI